MSTFAERLRQLRGTRQSKEFAEAAGISAGSLSAYENGSSMPTSRVLSRISESLGISLEWLLSGDGPPPEKEKPATSPVLKKTPDAQPIEITSPQKAEPATVAGFSEKLDLALGMLRELQPRMLSMMDQNSALQGEIAALREERAELKAEKMRLMEVIRRLEDDPHRLRGAALPFPSANAASAACNLRPDNESDGELDGPSQVIDRPDIGGLSGRGGAAERETSKK